MTRVLDPPPSILMAFKTPCSMSRSANSCNVALVGQGERSYHVTSHMHTIDEHVTSHMHTIDEHVTSHMISMY